MSGLSPSSTIQAGSLLRERCHALGLPTYRCDTAGVIVDEPFENGIAGIWLRSPLIANLLAETIRSWADESDPKLAELFEGFYAIPLVETRRGQRTGYTVAVALAPETLRCEQFEAACGSVQLDSAAARGAMRGLATFTAPSAKRVAALLKWTLADLAGSGEAERTINGFTRELADAYESIDFLQTLGASMAKLDQPGEFTERVVSHLDDATAFGWFALRFAADANLPDELRALTVIRTENADLELKLPDALDKLLEQDPPASECEIRAVADGFPSEVGPQVVIVPVFRAEKRVGIVLAGNKGGHDPQVSSYDTSLLQAAAGYMSTYFEGSALYREQQEMFLGVVKAMTAAIDAKDRYTRGHSERVAAMARALALEVGIDPVQADRIHIAGLVHDVGKIGVPEAVLTKNGRLTDEEYEQIKLHPEIGHGILKDIPALFDVLPGVLYHHERYDGKGYPHALAGEDIPLMARIIGLADTFDAMSSNRSYRPAMDRRRVLEEIARCAGTQFDPELAKAFLRLDLCDYDRMVREEAQAAGAEINRQIEQAAQDDAEQRAA